MFITVISLLVLTIINSVKGAENALNDIENAQINRYKRQDNNGWEFVECFLPPHPENGQWQVISGNGTPGSSIFPNTLIRFSCNKGFQMEPKVEYFICDADWDPSKMPRCIEQVCPPLKSSKIKIVKCFNEKGNPIECNKVPSGGTATTKCAPFYETTNEQASTVQCLNGMWSARAPECNIICGEEVKVQELQSSYKNKNIPKYPWIITIYQKDAGGVTFLCGGSLISTLLVITAGQCVTDADNKPKEASNFQVSAGKTYQPYGDPRDLMAQYIDVVHLKVHPEFSNYVYNRDLALLKTKRPFRLSALVQPICLRGLLEYSSANDDRGVIAMWGLTPNNEFTEEVKYFENHINRNECLRTITQDRRDFIDKYFYSDKFCVHFDEQSNTICKGYYGAGFAVRKTYKNRFFLEGIISVSLNDTQTGCWAQTSFCTKISFFYDFILDTMAKL